MTAVFHRKHFILMQLILGFKPWVHLTCLNMGLKRLDFFQYRMYMCFLFLMIFVVTFSFL